MKSLLPYGAIVALLALLGLLAGIAPTRMPQALAGGDFLSVLLGDAKKDISSAMVHEADSYFHGGVDMDCHHLHGRHNHDHGAHAQGEHGSDCESGHCAHDRHAEHDHHADEARDHGAGRFDPWLWINRHVRAPEIDRHLEGSKAVELMPWFWVAIKSDPHNVEAWSAAWYVASHIMKDETLAMRIASEGQRLNPESIEMTCVLGRAYRADSTCDTEKSEAMFRTVLDIALKKGKLEDDDQLPFHSALGYLVDSAKRRKDAKTLSELFAIAQKFAPNHPTTLNIARIIKSLTTSTLNPQPETRN